MGKIKIGCCGFPGGMKRYFSQFELVEVQQTFYKPPRLETALRWRKEAPPHFEFAIKAWQLITHRPSSPTYRRAGLQIPPEEKEDYGFFQPSRQVMEAWERTQQVGQALKAKVVVFQCPPSFIECAENIENMRSFFQAVGKRDFLFAWEPRGGWCNDTIQALCHELDLIHCVDPFEEEPLYGQLRYFRLHGGAGYHHTYSAQELQWLADRWGGEEDGYFPFNNLTMADDALRFKRLLDEQRAANCAQQTRLEVR